MALAEAALAVLGRAGTKADSGRAGESLWHYRTTTPDGMAFDIRCSGPDLPATVPGETILPSDIPKDPKWRGAYRLVVAPPVVAFDLCWDADRPLRIMTFSRGDWETQLFEIAE